MYNRKIIEWSHKTEDRIYKHPILTEDERGIKNKESVPRKKYAEMSVREQLESDRRRMRYYKNKVQYLTDIAIHNNLGMFVTLTFKDEVVDYEDAKQAWGLFAKRMRYAFGDNIKYIATHELQKRGVYHFHMLVNTDYVDHAVWSDIWKNGFVFIEKINATSSSVKRQQIRYIFKYLVKDILEKEGNGVRSNHRKIYCSRNLSKPVETRTLSDESVEDVIFANMEDIEETYTYDMKNHRGTKINEVDVIKIRKNGKDV